MEAMSQLASEAELYTDITTNLDRGEQLYDNGDYSGTVAHLNLVVATYEVLMLATASSTSSLALREQALEMYRTALFTLYKSLVRTGRIRDHVLELLLSSVERDGEMHRRVRVMAKCGLVSAVENDDALPSPSPR